MHRLLITERIQFKLCLLSREFREPIDDQSQWKSCLDWLPLCHSIPLQVETSALTDTYDLSAQRSKLVSSVQQTSMSGTGSLLDDQLTCNCWKKTVNSTHIIYYALLACSLLSILPYNIVVIIINIINSFILFIIINSFLLVYEASRHCKQPAPFTLLFIYLAYSWKCSLTQHFTTEGCAVRINYSPGPESIRNRNWHSVMQHPRQN